MAYPTPVNSRITDAVTQQNVLILGSAGAMAMSAVYQSAAHSISIAYENAVQAQRQASICAQAATNQGVIQLYSLGSSSAATASTRIGRSDTLHTALILLKALKALKQA
ncbi:MAG: RebB family R body protein [Caulobacterales bacterium]|nr:RebB family R body protein [Caulobacterales bacterium]